MSHNIKPSRSVGSVLFVPGRSHLGGEEGEEEEETSFETQHGDDTGLQRQNGNPHSLFSHQMVLQAWIFHSLIIFSPQGSPFPLLKAHVPMESTVGIVSLRDLE